MVWDSIDIRKIDDLLKEFEKASIVKELRFEEWVKKNHPDEIDVTDSVGVVTEGDFENNYSKKFITENFDRLGDLWFKGLNAQVDFGIVSNCAKDCFDDAVVCNYCDKLMGSEEDTLPKKDELNEEAVFRCKECKNKKKPLFV